jgi:hypothetical protein
VSLLELALRLHPVATSATKELKTNDLAALIMNIFVDTTPPLQTGEACASIVAISALLVLAPGA